MGAGGERWEGDREVGWRRGGELRYPRGVCVLWPIKFFIQPPTCYFNLPMTGHESGRLCHLQHRCEWHFVWSCGVILYMCMALYMNGKLVLCVCVQIRRDSSWKFRIAMTSTYVLCLTRRLGVPEFQL